MQYVWGIHGWSLLPKFQSRIFYSYQDIAVWKVDKMQTQVVQTKILNDYDFWLAGRNDLKLGTHMNIHKTVQKMPEYSVFKIHNGGYLANQVSKLRWF